MIKYLNGELSGMEMNRVERHIAICHMCADEIEGLSMLQSPGDIHGIANEINRRIDERLSISKTTRFTVPYYMKIAASLVVLMAISMLVYYSTKQITPPLIMSEQISKKEEKISFEAAARLEDTVLVLQDNEKIPITRQEEVRAIKPPQPQLVLNEITIISDENIEDKYEDEVETIAIVTVEPDTPKSVIDGIQEQPAAYLATANDYQSIGGIAAGAAAQRSKQKDDEERESTATLNKATKPVAYVSYDEEINEDQVFLVVEQMPVFENPEYDNSFKNYVQKNLHLPSSIIESSFKGKVFVEFIIESDGSISNVQVIQGIQVELDKEAVRVIESSPKWKPGVQRGKPVRVKMNFPISFEMK
jgi:TonB family protein